MKGGSFGGTARRWAATLLLTLALVSSAKASDLSDAKNLLRSKSAADRREGVALLVSRVDSRAAIQALEEVLQRSRKAMKNLTKDLDKQDLELTRAVGFIRHLEQSGEYQLIPFAIDAYKKERAKWEALAAEMLRNLLVCKDVESALPQFDSSSAMNAVDRGALSESDAWTRQMYVQALGARESSRGIPVLLALADSSDARLRALAGLALRPYVAHALVLEKLTTLVKDKHWSVRLRAAETIARGPFERAVPALIDAVQSERGQMAHSIDALLSSLTGCTFAESPTLWGDWWKKNKALVMEGTYVRPKKPRVGVHSHTRATFFRVPVPSENILFALDYSGSMTQEFHLKDARLAELRADLDLPDTRLGYAKAEVIRAIRALPDGIRFNVLVYSDEAELLSSKPLKASKGARRRAETWILKQDTGWLTNMWDALRVSFGDHLEGGGGRSRYMDLPDTIVFLTDGEPTRGRFQSLAPLRELVRHWNLSLGAVVHCVGVSKDHDAELLRTIAEDTNGFYVNLTDGNATMVQARREVPEDERLPHVGRTLQVALRELFNGSPEARRRAALGLVRLGPLAAPAAERLVELLEDPSNLVESAARRALVAIGTPAVPKLRPALQSEDVALVNAALDVVRRIGAEAVEVLPILTVLAMKDAGESRCEALDAIGAMGEAAKDAADTLKVLCKSGTEEVARHAAHALSEIRGG